MMTDRELLELAARSALEALRGYRRELGDNQPCDAEQALEVALSLPIEEPVQEPEPGEYHGWVLREVLFDNGEPVGHREPVREPVAFIHRQGNHWEVSERHLDEDEKARGWTEEPLYTAPPQRKENNDD